MKARKNQPTLGGLAQPGATATLELTTKRVDCGTMSGHWGTIACYTDSEPGVGRYAGVFEEIIGQNFADNTRIRVTVEVLDDGDGLRIPNTWHDLRTGPDYKPTGSLRNPWCDDCKSGDHIQ